MKIIDLNKNYLSSLYDFNHRMFPERKNYKEVLDHYLAYENEGLTNIIIDENDNVVGQNIFYALKYYFYGVMHDSLWGMDLIIEEKLRKDAWGLDLIQYGLHKSQSFATGSGPVALKINLALGCFLIGEIKKYVKIVNPLLGLTSLFRGNVPSKRFPNDIMVGKGQKFLRISDKYNLFNKATAYNADLLEFARDESFLKWRFFSGLHDYAFYKSQDSDNYFVLRTFVMHHITAMELVDYRCDASSPDEFDAILSASLKITKKLLLPIIVTGSSLAIFDSVLESKGAKVNGRNRPIISTTKEYKPYKQLINERRFTFVTLADSDGETTL
jgi:hypothetical protein